MTSPLPPLDDCPVAVIDGMCMTYRHDFGLVKSEHDSSMWASSGMTEDEREGLRRVMRQIWSHNIAPVITADKAEIARLTAERDTALAVIKLSAKARAVQEEHVARVMAEYRATTAEQAFRELVSAMAQEGMGIGPASDGSVKIVNRTAEASESRCAAVMAERDGMAEALKPFAAYPIVSIGHVDGAWEIRIKDDAPQPTFADFDRARAALEAQERTAS